MVDMSGGYLVLVQDFLLLKVMHKVLKDKDASLQFACRIRGRGLMGYFGWISVPLVQGPAESVGPNWFGKLEVTGVKWIM